MKHLSKIFIGLAVTGVVLASCDKKDAVAVYTPGTAPQLSISVAAVAPAPADSNAAPSVLSWTSPAYDRFSDNNVLYIVQFDSATKNFSNPQTLMTFTGGLSKGITAKDLNTYLVDKMGRAATVPEDLEFRILASKPNYDEQYTSNKVSFRYTPYIPDMPAFAPVPVTLNPVNNELYMVGDMTPGSWNNPVPTPTQKLAKNGSIYSLTLHINGGGQYLLLPVNGSWSNKYAVQNNSLANFKSGYFGFNVGSNFNDNFVGPTRGGTYFFRYDVSKGTYYLVLVGY